MKKKRLRILIDAALVVLMLTGATLVGAVFHGFGLHKTNVVIAYIFTVLLVARFTKGYIWGIASSVVSLLLFNWFFTEPYFTFKVNDMTYIITFVVMTFAAILTSALTTKVKVAAEEAMNRERESNTLYQMTNHLTDAEGVEEVAVITVRAVSEVLGCQSGFIIFDEGGFPESSFIQRKEDGSTVRRELDGAEELKKRMETLHTEADIGELECDYPIWGKSAILAVLRIPVERVELMSTSQTRMLHSVIESAALALERMRSLEAQARSREETTKERYRANLLRAISHDIRTPLSGIMGTSEMIMSKVSEDEDVYKMAKDINSDALWLHGLVENILNLTRLQEGKMIISKQPEALEEVIGAAVMLMEKRCAERAIQVELPDNVVIVPMDAKLVSQVIINLLDNAAKHTPPEKEISVSVTTDEEEASITVSDRGCGISKKDLPYVFQMFYTTAQKSPDAKRGVGLGLAICESIVEAHGGKIKAENRKGGGASFTFTLPLGGDSE